MSNIEQLAEPAVAPQLTPDLDMTSYIASMPAPPARNPDEDGPTILVQLFPTWW